MKKAFIAIALGLMVYAGIKVIAWPRHISGDCMEPAVKDGSYVFLNRLTPYIRAYKVNDIIFFNHEGKVWISRIVALANDSIQLDGGLLINGSKVEDGDIERDWNNWKYGTYAVEQPLQVPANHVYVLSDKLSAHHDDSRVFGPISQSAILGVIW